MHDSETKDGALRTLKTIILGTFAALAMGTSAFATDLYATTTSTYSEPGKATDWSGFYFGVLGVGTHVYETGCFECSENGFGVAKVFGYNWQSGNVIYGIDKMFVYWPIAQEPDVYKITFQAMARIGTEVTDGVMIYGAAGVGTTRFVDETPWAAYGAIASGVEVAMNDNLRWRTHLQWSRALQYPIANISVGTGIVWGFN